MRRLFLNFFSSWEVIFVITVIFILFAILFYFIVHRYFNSMLIKHSTHNTSGVFNILSISAVLMAFTIVVLWQFYARVGEVVIHESTELQQILAYSQGFPPQTSQAVKEKVGEYVSIVVDQEWPAMRKAEIGPDTEGKKVLQQLFNIFIQFPPQDENQRLLYNKILDSYESVIAARDIRFDATDSAIPTYFFRVIIINLLLLIMSVCLLDEKGLKAPLIVSILVAAIAGLNLGLTFSLDFPFSGEHSISSEPFTRDILGELYQEYKQ